MDIRFWIDIYVFRTLKLFFYSLLICIVIEKSTDMGTDFCKISLTALRFFSVFIFIDLIWYALMWNYLNLSFYVCVLLCFLIIQVYGFCQHCSRKILYSIDLWVNVNSQSQMRKQVSQGTHSCLQPKRSWKPYAAWIAASPLKIPLQKNKTSVWPDPSADNGIKPFSILSSGNRALFWNWERMTLSAE